MVCLWFFIHFDYFIDGKNLRQLFLEQENGLVKIIDFTSFEDYNNTLDYYLNETKLELESSYKTQEQVFTIK